MGAVIGALVMAYGSPASIDDVAGYYTHIRRGHPPEPAQLADLVRRYEAIGGVSPLRARTEAQAAAIARSLDERRPGGFQMALGMKHATPFVEDAASSLVEAGVDAIVGLVLAPHYSAASVGQYHERAATVATAAGVDYRAIEHWYDEPAYVDFLAREVSDRLASMPDRTKVFFTAHALPVRVLEADPYVDQLRASAEAVAARAELSRFAEWGVCFQSAGRTAEPWVGPDILDMIRALGETGRAEAVLVCPHGFVTDHLEVAYDLDLEAAAVAGEAGLAFARTATVDDDPTVMDALAARITSLAGAHGA